jgi:hypothetical protein
VRIFELAAKAQRTLLAAMDCMLLQPKNNTQTLQLAADRPSASSSY